MLNLRWEIKENNNNVIFEVQKCDSLREIFTCTQLPKFFWQANFDEIVNNYHQSLLYFQK